MEVISEKLRILLNRNADTDPSSIEKQFCHHLEYTIGKNHTNLKNEDIYKALGYTVRDFLIDRLNKTSLHYNATNPKRIYYFSLEFLIGRTLHNAIINLGIYENIKVVMEGFGYSLQDTLEIEMDAGLGNGGLGRLAACFMDSLATLNLPGFGYGIRYDYGIFNQIIANGAQIEMPDHWDADGSPYEIVRLDHTYPVNFFGKVETRVDGTGRIVHEWVPTETILARAHDYPVPGFNTDNVNYMRLWAAKSSEEFNLDYFNHGDYMKAVEDKSMSENISKVLYPNDTTEQGKLLRLKQQYFMVSASLQDILQKHKSANPSFDNLADLVAIQLNDTHPSIAIAELMRFLVDEERFDWDRAWGITTKVFAYTNHTVLPEALEAWGVHLFEQLLPRHMEIIYEINQRFLDQVRAMNKLSEHEISEVSLIQEGSYRRVRMANLAIVGSHKVNGVAALHSELLKITIFKSFYKIYPEKFNNKTNGITQRRWLVLANPRLSAAIAHKIGDRFAKDLYELKKLEPLAMDTGFQDQWSQIKRQNKVDLAKIIKSDTGITISPDAMFDVQIKRFHEYKRQLLNILRVIGDYVRIKENPQAEYVPRVVMFGGKAAPGYYMAKLIIRLINAVGDVVNKDKDVDDRLKVIFLPNYRVSLAEKIIPASDLSEQISTAGTEASGTGNMKFALNGALTIGTLDGANVEIMEEVGEENIFIFGLKAEEVMDLKHRGYHPKDYLAKNENLNRVMTLLRESYFAPGTPGLFHPIYENLISIDNYLLLADYESYVSCQKKVAEEFKNKKSWTGKSILNVARMGKFSTDRTIMEYSTDIWGVKPSPVSATPLATYKIDPLGDTKA